MISLIIFAILLFFHRFNTNVNHNLSAHALFRYSNRWFTLRCEVLGVICVITTAVACVAFKDRTSPAVAGIVLANMFQAATFLPYLTRLTSEFRARSVGPRARWPPVCVFF